MMSAFEKRNLAITEMGWLERTKIKWMDKVHNIFNMEKMM